MRAFGLSRASAIKNNQSGHWRVSRQGKEIIPVASNYDRIGQKGVLPHFFHQEFGSQAFPRRDLPRDLAAASNGQLRSQHLRQRETSLISVGSLRRYQRVNFSLVILVIRQALVNLSAPQMRKTGHHFFHCRSCVNHGDDIMYSDSRAFNDGAS
jgi:hypothetical protein